MEPTSVWAFSRHPAGGGDFHAAQHGHLFAEVDHLQRQEVGLADEQGSDRLVKAHIHVRQAVNQQGDNLFIVDRVAVFVHVRERDFHRVSAGVG